MRCIWIFFHNWKWGPSFILSIRKKLDVAVVDVQRGTCQKCGKEKIRKVRGT